MQKIFVWQLKKLLSGRKKTISRQKYAMSYERDLCTDLVRCSLSFYMTEKSRQKKTIEGKGEAPGNGLCLVNNIFKNGVGVNKRIS